MYNGENVDIVPVMSRGPNSAWIYYSLADGLIDGTTTTTIKNRAFGAGKVASPDLTYAGTVGTLWTDASGRASFPDGGVNDVFSADLDPVTAAAFSFAGSGVLICWAHGNFATDTDTGSHTILQIGGGGNSKNGFNFQIHQNLRRVQLMTRTGADLAETSTAIGQTNGLTAGTDATIAAVVDFATKQGYCWVDGRASSGGTYGPTSGTLTLDAADTANRIAVGAPYSGGSINVSQMFKGPIQRVGAMKCATMPSDISGIMYSLAMRKGVPSRELLAL